MVSATAPKFQTRIWHNIHISLISWSGQYQQFFGTYNKKNLPPGDDVLALVKNTQNGIFSTFHKIWHYFLLKVSQNERRHVFPSYLGKFQFIVIGQNVLDQSKLQDSLIINISGNKASIYLIFCMEIVTKKKQHVRLLLLIACVQAYPAMPKV